jgi:hypothetical protein
MGAIRSADPPGGAFPLPKAVAVIARTFAAVPALGRRRFDACISDHSVRWKKRVASVIAPAGPSRSNSPELPRVPAGMADTARIVATSLEAVDAAESLRGRSYAVRRLPTVATARRTGSRNVSEESYSRLAYAASVSRPDARPLILPRSRVEAALALAHVRLESTPDTSLRHPATRALRSRATRAAREDETPEPSRRPGFRPSFKWWS